MFGHHVPQKELCLSVLCCACLCYAVLNRVWLCWSLRLSLLFRNRILALIPIYTCRLLKERERPNLIRRRLGSWIHWPRLFWSASMTLICYWPWVLRNLRTRIILLNPVELKAKLLRQPAGFLKWMKSFIYYNLTNHFNAVRVSFQTIDEHKFLPFSYIPSKRGQKIERTLLYSNTRCMCCSLVFPLCTAASMTPNLKTPKQLLTQWSRNAP